MEAILHERTIQRVPVRSRANRKAVDRPHQPAVRDFPKYTQFVPRRIRRILAVAVAGMVVAGTVPAAIAQNLKRGEELLSRHCASCHAVGRTGDSPHKFAPPFRTLGQRYPIDSLEEALGEGIMSGHPDMPEFSFDAGDVGAIIAYLKSIQQR